MVSESTELERKLIDRINREGPITFRDFMQAALYDHELGYYNTWRTKIGAAGDYYTSSNVHTAFGAVLASAFIELWSGWTGPLKIIEFGAGTGQLAYDVLTTMRAEYSEAFQSLRYVIVETSPAMRTRQRHTLNAFADRVDWCELEEIERKPVTGIVFSNEFVDALPVHLLRFKGSEITEAYLSVRQSEPARLTMAWREPSSERLATYVERMGVNLREDQIIEINLQAVDWLARIAHGLQRGILITIDYGDVARLLWSPDRSSGTLRCFHKHRLMDSPLERIGEQDITASVNFTALAEYGRDFGFETISFERQTAFLIRLGLIERIASERDPSESLDDVNERLAVKNLFIPGGISDSFRVLVQRR